MAISVTCPSCGKTVKAPDSAAGRKGKCPACGSVFEVPAPPAGGGPPDDAAAALARALAEAGGEPPPAAEDAAAALAGAVEGAPAEAAPPAAAAPAAPAAAAGEVEAVEDIAVPPIGVQTPSGLPVEAGGRAAGHRWQRKLAGIVRLIGLALGGLSLAFGIVAMIVMATQGPHLLVPGIGVFLMMFIVGAMSALAGLLARHMLLLLADLGEDVRDQGHLLDSISERIR